GNYTKPCAFLLHCRLRNVPVPFSREGCPGVQLPYLFSTKQVFTVQQPQRGDQNLGPLPLSQIYGPRWTSLG
uniref:Uncharacterized protein n=1 Tax=Calidris pygmaea TaxID=425635 RepID=A0A8C3JE42_9CHAR